LASTSVSGGAILSSGVSSVYGYSAIISLGSSVTGNSSFCTSMFVVSSGSCYGVVSTDGFLKMFETRWNKEGFYWPFKFY
jgi:hypothetical protein